MFWIVFFCFGGYTNSCSGGKCEVQSGTHLKSKWSCTQLVMKAHCSDLFTHTLTHTHTAGLLPWRLKQQRTHTGISQDNKTLRRKFCLVFGILMHFLYIDYFFYFVLFSDLKVRGYGIISDVFSSCITCHPHHFSLSM